MNPIDGWPLLSHEPACPPGVVLIVALPLSTSGTALERNSSLLDGTEAARAACFLAEEDRHRFILAHAGMRRALGRWVGCHPAALSFGRKEGGKPFLIGAKMPGFNLSHAGTQALLAISADREIGVDIEKHDERVAIDAIAQNFFTPKEIAMLTSLPSERRLAGFFTCWTRKEAVVKAIGSGLQMPLDSFSVLASISGGLSLQDINVGEGYSAAVAAAGTWRLISRRLPAE